MLPERFDLHYIDEHGERQRPVAIHRAILGSLERFIGVITEHFAGAFPFWCSPVQAVVIPIADRHVEAAERAGRILRAKGIRVEVDDSSSRMQNKIRLAQEQKIPYMLVLGDREVEARTRRSADAAPRRVPRRRRSAGTTSPSSSQSRSASGASADQRRASSNALAVRRSTVPKPSVKVAYTARSASPGSGSPSTSCRRTNRVSAWIMICACIARAMSRAFAYDIRARSASPAPSARSPCTR